MTQAGSTNVQDAEASDSPVGECGTGADRSISWTTGKLLAAIAMTALGVLVTFDAWADIVSIAWHDEEASHIFLVPIVVAWLVWSRREQLLDIPVGPSLIGPALVALGGVLNWYGFGHMVQALWHGGTVLVAVGCFLTVVGHHVLWRLWPAFVVLGFLVPVPGLIRQEIALPLQTATAASTAAIYHAFAVDIVRNGNVLRFNGMDIAVAEACNGMRMVFALLLVTYAVAFISPLRAWVRVLVLLLSPVFAIACNVIRLLPTVWLYGYYPETIGPVFHQVGGWVMIGVAWAMVAGFINLLHWADIPVMQDSKNGETNGPANREMRKAAPGRCSGLPALLTFCICAFLLAGVATVTLARPEPADAEPYHARVRAAAAELPRQFGDWVGRDAEVPTSAQKLLRPNVILSRIYTNLATGVSATLVIVHCRDARDMIGHFPPACYPNSGWTPQGAVPASWIVDGVPLTGMEYTFSFRRPTGTDRMVVDNLLILPNGALVRNMEQVTQVAANYAQRFYGAAQVQVLTPAALDDQQREAIFDQVVGAALPLIQTIRSGGAGQAPPVPASADPSEPQPSLNP